MGLNAQYQTTTPAFKLTTAPTSGYALSTDPSASGNRPLACYLQATTQNIRFTVDGTAPTATVGMLLVAGAEPFYYAGSLIDLRFIQTTSGAVLNVVYAEQFSGEPGQDGAPGADGLVTSVVAGENITVDSSTPSAPVVAMPLPLLTDGSPVAIKVTDDNASVITRNDNAVVFGIGPNNQAALLGVDAELGVSGWWTFNNAGTPQIVSAAVPWDWPTTLGAAGSVLTDVAGDGTLSFEPAGGGGAISVSDGSTTVDPCTSITFTGIPVFDLGGGIAGVGADGITLTAIDTGASAILHSGNASPDITLVPAGVPFANPSLVLASNDPQKGGATQRWVADTAATTYCVNDIIYSSGGTLAAPAVVAGFSHFYHLYVTSYSGALHGYVTSGQMAFESIEATPTPNTDGSLPSRILLSWTKSGTCDQNASFYNSGGFPTLDLDNSQGTGIAIEAPGVVRLVQNFDGSLANVHCAAITSAPPASITPTVNGEMVFELTSDTTLTIKVKGSDGTVRSVALTLAP